MTGAAPLETALEDIWQAALDLGLDPFPTHFEIVPATIMYEIGAYGLPGRFSHWTHGKAFQRMKTAYDYGLARIYELVINTNPCHAFLLDTNGPLENKLVCAHVLAHSDFFRHNVHFAGTDRDMAERAHLNAGRIRAYEYRHGRETVEAFLDAALAVEAHVDPWLDQDEDDEERLAEDLLLFLRQRAPGLEDWQRDVLAIVRAERLYFWPQIRTKVVNEGWATFWHARILRSIRLTDAEYAEFARLHAAVQSPGGVHVNPYGLGGGLMEAVAAEEGLEAVFEIRDLDDDLAFLRNHLTPERVHSLGLFRFGLREDVWEVQDDDPQAVLDLLLASRVNGGAPVIVVADDDYGGRRELLLRHRYDGRQLRIPDAVRALGYVASIWGRRAHLETVVQGERQVLTSDARGG